jgi:hypothetical protein
MTATWAAQALDKNNRLLWEALYPGTDMQIEDAHQPSRLAAQEIRDLRARVAQLEGEPCSLQPQS